MARQSEELLIPSHPPQPEPEEEPCHSDKGPTYSEIQLQFTAYVR
jgi:hypothetical protein